MQSARNFSIFIEMNLINSYSKMDSAVEGQPVQKATFTSSRLQSLYCVAKQTRCIVQNVVPGRGFQVMFTWKEASVWHSRGRRRQAGGIVMCPQKREARGGCARSSTPVEIMTNQKPTCRNGPQWVEREEPVGWGSGSEISQRLVIFPYL